MILEFVGNISCFESTIYLTSAIDSHKFRKIKRTGDGGVFSLACELNNRQLQKNGRFIGKKALIYFKILYSESSLAGEHIVCKKVCS